MGRKTDQNPAEKEVKATHNRQTHEVAHTGAAVSTVIRAPSPLTQRTKTTLFFHLLSMNTNSCGMEAQIIAIIIPQVLLSLYPKI